VEANSGTTIMQVQHIGPKELKIILKDVGEDCCVQILEPDALIRGLDLCLSWYKDALKYHTNKYSAEQIRHGSLIIKASKRLERLLADAAQLEIFRSPELTDHCMRAIRLVREESRIALEISSRGHSARYRANYQKRSPFEWLVAYFLPLVYINGGFAHIGDEKAFLGQDSPYIRFAMAAVREFGISNDGESYARSSFIKALSNAISDKVRRTSEKTSEDGYARWRLRLMKRALWPECEAPI
jgi:hypothetical protein